MYFSPNPRTYAVIRLNPVAMVEHLDDPEALSAAEALQTKAYIVYIRCVRIFRAFRNLQDPHELLTGTGASVPRKTLVPLQRLSDRTLATSGG